MEGESLIYAYYFDYVGVQVMKKNTNKTTTQIS